MGGLQVHLTKANRFSASVMKNSRVRKMMSWLLFRPDALHSYQSIYYHYEKESYVDKNGWEIWQFRFDLPDLSGWKMSLRGRYLDDSNRLFFVEEIYGLKNAAQMPSKVTFTGECFDKYKLVEGPGTHVVDEEGDRGVGSDKRQKMGPLDENSEISDGVEPSDLATPVIFTLQSEGMSFCTPFESKIIERVKGQRSDGTAGTVDVERPGESVTEEYETLCSTNEATLYGTGRQVETVPETQEDEKNDQGTTEDDGSTFAAFNKMVSLLLKNNKWELVEDNVFELEKVGRSRLHLLKKTDKLRQVKTVRLSKKIDNGVLSVRLIEVDTTDGVKALSTKILQQDDQRKWTENLSDLRTELVKKSITWPNETLSKICRNSVKSLFHPHCHHSKINDISDEEIERWAERADLEMSTVEEKKE